MFLSQGGSFVPARHFGWCSFLLATVHVNHSNRLSNSCSSATIHHGRKGRNNVVPEVEQETRKEGRAQGRNEEGYEMCTDSACSASLLAIRWIQGWWSLARACQRRSVVSTVNACSFKPIKFPASYFFHLKIQSLLLKIRSLPSSMPTVSPLPITVPFPTYSLMELSRKCHHPTLSYIDHM